MKTLERYVFGSFLTSFFLAFIVLSFVLTIGLLVQIVGYMLQGVPIGLVGEFALVSIPETMQWTIPIALLVASILVFSRLSADSEVAAMRACGVNLLSIMRWPLIFGAFCTVLGIFINNEIVPRGHEVRRSVARRISVGAGLELLEPGRVIDDFPNAKIFFESREGDWIRELVVLDYSNPSFDRQITASKALVKSEGRDVVLDLYDMTIDPVDEGSMNMARAARFQYRVKDALKDGQYKRKVKDFTLLPRVNMDGTVRSEMLTALAEAKENVAKAKGRSRVKGTERDLARRELSRLKTEYMKRWVSAFAAICFVLIGVPLGIRAQRRESTIGMAIALATALGYNLMVLLMTSIAKNHAVHPEYLIWLPVLICLALASWLIPKNL